MTPERVRDRYLAKVAVDQAYSPEVRTAAWAPPREITLAIVESTWETRLGSTSKESFGGLTRAVGKLLGLLKRAPQVVGKLVQTLGIEGWSEMSWPARASALKERLTELVREGKKVLAKVFKGLSHTFPLSLFFVEKGKMPGLTDLMRRITEKAPWLKKALDKVHSGAEVFDYYFKKYVPVLPRALYAAIFTYVWLSVFELSWDVQGLIAGFTGRISLSELLATLPESAIGLLVAQLGLGTFAALPLTLIARLIWLASHKYLEYNRGRLVVRWDLLGVEDQRPEAIPL